MRRRFGRRYRDLEGFEVLSPLEYSFLKNNNKAFVFQFLEEEEEKFGAKVQNLRVF